MSTTNRYAPLAGLPTSATGGPRRNRHRTVRLAPIDIVEDPTTMKGNRLERAVETAQESVHNFETGKLSYPNTHGLFFPQKASDRFAYIAQPILKALTQLELFLPVANAIPALASPDARGPLAGLSPSARNGMLIGSGVVAASLLIIKGTLTGPNPVNGWIRAKGHQLEQSVLGKVNTEGFTALPGTDEAQSVLNAFRAQQNGHAGFFAAATSLTIGLAIICDREILIFGLVGVALLLIHAEAAYGYDLHTAKKWVDSQAHAARLSPLTSGNDASRQQARNYLNEVANAFVENHPYRYAIAVVAFGGSVAAAVLGTIRPAESTPDVRFGHLRQNVLTALPLFAVGINSLLVVANQSRALAGSTVAVADIKRFADIERARRELQKANNELIEFNEAQNTVG